MREKLIILGSEHGEEELGTHLLERHRFAIFFIMDRIEFCGSSAIKYSGSFIGIEARFIAQIGQAKEGAHKPQQDKTKNCKNDIPQREKFSELQPIFVFRKR